MDPHFCSECKIRAFLFFDKDLRLSCRTHHSVMSGLDPHSLPNGKAQTPPPPLTPPMVASRGKDSSMRSHREGRIQRSLESMTVRHTRADVQQLIFRYDICVVVDLNRLNLCFLFSLSDLCINVEIVPFMSDTSNNRDICVLPCPLPTSACYRPDNHSGAGGVFAIS